MVPGTAANGGWSTTTTPSNSWGWPFREGGLVKGYAHGGAVGSADFADKVKAAFTAFKEMREGGMVERKGLNTGGVPGFPDGIMLGAPMFSGFTPQTRGPMSPAYAGNPFAQFPSGLTEETPFAMAAQGLGGLNTTGLTYPLDAMASAAPAAAPPVAGVGPRPTSAPVQVPGPHPGTARSPWSAATGLLLAGSPLSNMATHIIQDQEARLRAGQLLGNLYGQPTMEGQKLPSQIALAEAQTRAAEVAADREFQSRLKREEMEVAKQLELQKLENQMALLNRLRSDQGGGAGTPQGTPAPNTVLEWSPPSPAPVTAGGPPPAAPAPPPTPPIPFFNQNPRTGVRFGTFAQPYPYDQRNRATFGEHFIGQDGLSIYKRGNNRTGDVYVGPAPQ